MSLAKSSALGPYLNAPILLYILDGELLKQLLVILKKFGFTSVVAGNVPPDYLAAVHQLADTLLEFDGLVLANPPTRHVKDSSGVVHTVVHLLEFFDDLSEFLTQRTPEHQKIMAKCVPVFEAVQDAGKRMQLIQDLIPYGVLGAFMLREQSPHQPRDLRQEERMQEVYDLLVDFFLQKDNQLAHFKDYRTAEELKALRAEVEELMQEVDRLKSVGDFDRAVAMCRRCTEILPSDPDAYLEGGRLLVKKKKYAPAFQMFRDAEAVASGLPAPNQEIGMLRVAQVKDYLAQRRAQRQPVDQSKVDELLGEAVINFETALSKAATIPSQNEAKRLEATAHIVDAMLTSGMTEACGRDHPQVQALLGLAQKALGPAAGSAATGGRLLVQLGLLAFLEGDYDRAEALLLQAAGHPELFEDACTKLNYLGTQLRRRGDPGRAVRCYQKLLQLGPSFAGVARFNLAVAQATQALDLKAPDSPGYRELEKESLANALAALVTTPTLIRDPNFYRNTVMLPVFRTGRQLFRPRASEGPSGDPQDATCRQAGRRLEGLIGAGQDREAVKLLLTMGQSLPGYFLNFDRYASGPVLAFARRLQPLLLKQRDPKMQILGKIMKVMVAKGQAAAAAAGPGEPALAPARRALAEQKRAQAARELALVAHGRPELLAPDAALGGEPELAHLAAELSRLLAGLNLEAFAGAAK
ncbi:MAG: hypothetical protein KQJ78_10390 [Deltaproteobacteria bacterium]|nr:hypothetical protein [Deltaproteobacteria bacterium]